MTGRYTVLSAVADRLDGATWPSEVTRALAVIRAEATRPSRFTWSRNEDGVPLPVEVLDVFNVIGPYDAADPVLVDLADATVDLAASLEPPAGPDPSSSLPHDPNGEQ